MDKQISPAKSLRGTVAVPGDKSISHRSVMIAALSDGVSEIRGFLQAADPLSTVSCFSSLGINHRFENDTLYVFGKGLYGLRQPSGILDAGNSGTTMRLMSGILAGQSFSTVISGDQYLVKRPMKRVIDPLYSMGAQISSSANHTAPLTITGKFPLKAIDYVLPMASAQVKSAILLAGLFADGVTSVIESEPSRDHTERMLQLSATKKDGKTIISVAGGMRFSAKNFLVPGDPSSAAFFIVAGLIVPHSELIVHNVGLNPTRIGFLEVLRKMNASLVIENQRNIGGEPVGDIIVRSSDLRSNITLEGEIIPNVIDEIPILSVAAAFAHGTFTVKNAKDLRNKETDRITAVCTNLRKMGVDVAEHSEGFAFESKNSLVHSDFDSFGDHRIAMAFGVAGLALKGPSTINDAECVAISFPSFWEILHSLQQ